jgi:shikimate kinase
LVRAPATVRLDRRTAVPGVASIANAVSTGAASSASLPAPVTAPVAVAEGGSATTAGGAARDRDDLERLTDRVYDRLMERLRIERESLGL